MSQLPLPLAHRERREADDFVITQANRAAVAHLERVADWPMPAALLLGPAGAGKTHLAGIFAARTGARVLDDLDRARDETRLFHAWNAATRERPLLLVSRTDPRAWELRLPDLASRLAATPRAVIGPPDDALLAAVMAKRFRDRGLDVEPDVVRFLVMRLERSFAGVAQAVDRLDAAALAEGRPVTVPFARAILFGQLDLLT